MFQYIAFYKPYGFLSQFTAEAGHEGLAGFHLPSGVYAAGRLDHDSEGLLLLTDDGKMIKKLLDPVFEHPRSYLAQLDGTVTPQAVEALKKGVVIKNYKTKPCRAEILAKPPALSADTLSEKYSDVVDPSDADRRQKQTGAPYDRRRRIPDFAFGACCNRKTDFGRVKSGTMEKCSKK